MSVQIKPLTIWRISDGKPGHDSQSLGLTAALSTMVEAKVFNFRAGSGLKLLALCFSPPQRVPNPDLIIGAGHATHLPLLCAKTARGGKTIVLMKPSLPTACFDLCLIPEHDSPAPKQNILPTRGALNNIEPSTNKDPAKGLILIGGPSRHYRWDEKTLAQQIRQILEQDAVQWTLTDSPRTPDSTRQIFRTLQMKNLIYLPYAMTSRYRLIRELAISGSAWITEDSVSMLYEALTSGAAVGILKTPANKPNRIALAVTQLVNDGLVTRFDDWSTGSKLKLPKAEFNESRRCARLVLGYFSFSVQ